VFEFATYSIYVQDHGKRKKSNWHVQAQVQIFCWRAKLMTEITECVDINANHVLKVCPVQSKSK
jgi:hypothetical protein